MAFQGAVPEGYSEKRFRETGRTSKIVKGKEVLAKDSLNKENKKKGKKIGIKNAFKGKFTKTPKAKLPSVNPSGFISSGGANTSLVKEGRTGHFREEYVGETKWLS